MLLISERSLRRVARQKISGSSILAIVLRQALCESWLRLRKNLQFRVRRNGEACEAYCAMSLSEFEGINARQWWANWRTIPRNLNGRVPLRPVRAIDLCCGIGQSTEVLAHYLAPGSSVLGLEYNPRFVSAARARQYFHQDGRPCRVRFHAQSVLETFRNGKGPLTPGSVDLVNSSGAVGCHFDRDATRLLAREITRVLRPGGLALLDCGPHGTTEEELTEIFGSLGFEDLHRTRSCFVDRYTQLCLRKT